MPPIDEIQIDALDQVKDIKRKKHLEKLILGSDPNLQQRTNKLKEQMKSRM